MIDLHSHVLPGVDDGAGDLAASLAMAKRYVARGFSCVIATPHALPEAVGTDTARRFERLTAQLNGILRAKSLDLTLEVGMEIAMGPEVPDLLDTGRLLTLAGSRHVLIEAPFERLPIHWEQMLFQITGRGYQVLLAHPERCAQLARNHALIDRVVAMGVHLQVNWGSFTGVFGRPAMKTARHLARQGYIHCLATDSHDNRGRSADVVDRAAPKIRALIGAANLNLLSNDNPARVVADHPLETMQMTQASRKAKEGWKR
jgi:protein-tyrosine phosphatase